MPVIRITAADIQKTKTIDEKWYPARIVKVGEVEASNDKKSMNLRVVALLTHNGDGKEIECVFNSKLWGKLVPLIEAARGSMGSIKSEDFDFDSSEILNKDVDAYVVIDTFNGQNVNKINNWAPKGSMINAKGVF